MPDATPGDARSELRNSVIFGADGQLFHRDHDAVEQVTGKLRFSETELEWVVSAIETRHAWCREHNIRYLHMIVPEKHVVYSDKLPEPMRVSAERPVRQILSRLASHVLDDLIYPEVDLRDRRSAGDTFYKTDTHWTTQGAFLTYQIMARRLEQITRFANPIGEHELNFQDFVHTGDLGVRLDPEQSEPAIFLRPKRPTTFKKVYDNRRFDRGNVIVWENSNRSLPRCVVFSDSFLHYVIQFMIPCFSRLVAVSSTDVYYDLLRSEQPDVVIFEMIERYVAMLDGTGVKAFLPRDFCAGSFAEFSGVSPSVLADATLSDHEATASPTA
jgi:alginate O-acetyltransferase complex protein AlgJ